MHRVISTPVTSSDPPALPAFLLFFLVSNTLGQFIVTLQRQSVLEPVLNISCSAGDKANRPSGPREEKELWVVSKRSLGYMGVMATLGREENLLPIA